MVLHNETLACKDVGFPAPGVSPPCLSLPVVAGSLLFLYDMSRPRERMSDDLEKHKWRNHCTVFVEVGLAVILVGFFACLRVDMVKGEERLESQINGMRW